MSSASQPPDTVAGIIKMINDVATIIGKQEYDIRPGSFVITYKYDLDVALRAMGGPLVQFETNVAPNEPAFRNTIHDALRMHRKLYEPMQLVPYSLVKDTREPGAKWRREKAAPEPAVRLEKYRILYSTTILTRVTVKDRISKLSVTLESETEGEWTLKQRALTQLAILVTDQFKEDINAESD